MRTLIALPLVLCAASPAAASGGLWCDTEDDKVKIAINSGVGRGMGGPLFSFEGSIEIKDAELAEDVRKTSYDHAVQYWLDGEVLNLLVYWERPGDGEFASVEGTFMTRYGDEDEGSYHGDYAVTVYGGKQTADGEPLRYAGKFSCGVE